MSGGSGRGTALEATGARLGELLRRALADRLARRSGDDRGDDRGDVKLDSGAVPQGDAARVARAEGPD